MEISVKVKVKPLRTRKSSNFGVLPRVRKWKESKPNLTNEEDHSYYKKNHQEKKRENKDFKQINKYQNNSKGDKNSNLTWKRVLGFK